MHESSGIFVWTDWESANASVSGSTDNTHDGLSQSPLNVRNREDTIKHQAFSFF